MQNYKQGARLFGILCVPMTAGKYPAILRVPVTGVRPYNGDINNINNARKGIITYEIGIHGIPVTLDASVYENIREGSLDGYPNLRTPDLEQTTLSPF